MPSLITDLAYILTVASIVTIIFKRLKQPLVLEQWDDQLWNLLVLKAVVSTDGTVVFTFKGENTITVRVE